jgi:signal peptidase I
MHILREIYNWASSIVTGVALALFINMFLFQPTTVAGNSMQPTLEDQDFIALSRLSRTLHREPNYGDIVVIDSRVNRSRTWQDDLVDPYYALLNSTGISPNDRHHLWVKRIIGKAGDVLEFRDGKVYRNGTALNEPYLKETMRYSSTKKIVIPENHVFVLGDNRNNSADSRYIGTIPTDHILGTMLFKLPKL